MVEVAFLFLRFLRQDVAVISVTALNLPRSGKGEPLFCTGVGFYFRHFLLFLLIENFRRLREDTYDTARTGYFALLT